jgi:DNA modification methylase
MSDQTTTTQDRKDLSAWVNDIHQGDAADTLARMPESSVHCVMTSPPYFGLRDYGADGQIGLENTLDEYIQELVDVAGELRRVLRPDGSWWLNLGDSFAGSGRGQWDDDGGEPKESYRPDSDSLPDQETRLRRKSKMLVPHRVAIALQDAGWIVRSDAVWRKTNPMPHPVKDRLTEHKEFVFHLTPEPDYWFDLDAIREQHKDTSLERDTASFEASGRGSLECPREDKERHVGTDADDALHERGKNPGDIFELSVESFSDAHFAVYPTELCEKPIKSTCPPKVCANCGTPYERITETVPMWERDPSTIDRQQTRRALEIADEHGLTDEHFRAAQAVGIGDLDGGEGNPYHRVDDETERLAREAADALGSYYREALMSEPAPTDKWSQECSCDMDETQSGIVLDPFAGAGTTALVGKELGRRFVGIDLNPEYVAMAQKRVGVTVDEPERLLEDDETSLEAFADGGDSR